MTAFLMAWQMFLWIPCPSTKWDQNKVKEMLLWLPVIGLIAGGLWYVVSVSSMRRSRAAASGAISSASITILHNVSKHFIFS